MRKLGINQDTAKIQRLFSGRLYSDSYHFITEVVSNAKDAHTRIGQTKPVDVSIKTINGDRYFIVRDYGCSMTPEEFFQNIGVLAYSDKEKEEESIGNMGIGSIAFCGYTDEAEYTCIKNGKKFTVEIKETEEDGIVFNDKINLVDTTEPTGVIFKLKIKKGDPQFQNKILHKLAYFGNINYDFDGDVSKNYFNIYRNDLFQVSDLSKEKTFHITLDDVYYPIDYNKLGISPIIGNLAIRLHLSDKIRIATTRESLIYDDHLKNLLLKRIDLIKKELVKRYHEKYCSKPIHFKEYLVGEWRERSILLGENTVPVTFPGYKLNEPEIDKYKKEVVLAFNQTKDDFYRFRYHYLFDLQLEYLNKLKCTHLTWINHSLLSCTAKCYFTEELALKTKKTDFLKFLHPEGGIRMYSKKKVSLHQYKKFLGLKNKKKSEWRDLIVQYQQIADEFRQPIDFDSISYTKSFEDSRKKPSTRTSLNKKKDEITFKVAREPLVSTINYAKFDVGTKNIYDIPKEPYLTIYGNSEKRDLLEKAFIYTRKRSKIRVVMINKTEETKIQKLEAKNVMEVENFLSKDNKFIRECVTSNMIKDLMKTYHLTFNSVKEINNTVSREFAEDLTALASYINSKNYEISNEHFKKELYEMAKSLKMYDLSIHHIYEKVSKNISNFDFLDFFYVHLNETSPKYKNAVKSMHDILMTRKVRMNWENYMDGGAKNEKTNN